MRSELKLLNQRLGVTTLYVTHGQVEAMTMGDRVAVLQPIGDAGQSNLQQIDTPQMLYDRPLNMFVAGFIGSPAMNFLRVDLVRDGETIRASVVGIGQRLAVPATPALSPYCGDRAIVGIRPEAFEVCGEGEAMFHEPVPVAEALGADTFVFFDIDSPPVGAADVGEDLRRRHLDLTTVVRRESSKSDFTRYPSFAGKTVLVSGGGSGIACEAFQRARSESRL